MELLIIIFMILVVALCAFTITTVVADQINERRKQKRMEDDEADEPVQSAEPVAPVAAEEPVTPVEQPIVVVAAADEEAQDGQVVFAAVPKQTHSEKYKALSGEQRGWYDEIAAYAASRDAVIKSVVTNGYEEYRYYGKRVVRFVIKRGVIICEYIISNTDFSRYVSANKVSVKQSAATLKIVEAKDVSAAKDSVDIAVKFLVEERQEAKRLERERRREARQKAAAAKAANTAND